MNPYALRLYVLDQDNMPRCVPDVLEWAQWFGGADRSLRITEVHTPGAGTVRVSTVFLGIDHNYSGEGPPILWETMVFGGPHDGDMNRYASVSEALAGHEHAVANLRDSALTEKS